MLKKYLNRECYVNLNVECIKRDTVEDDLFVIGAAGGVFISGKQWEIRRHQEVAHAEEHERLVRQITPPPPLLKFCIFFLS